MGFVSAVRTCLKKYLTLSGRAARPEYWWFYLFVFLVTAAANVLDGMIFGFSVEDTAGKHPFTLLASFVLLFPLLAAGWRRMQDTGHPGWFIVLPQILLLGGLAAMLVSVGVAGLLSDLFGAAPERVERIDSVVAVVVTVLMSGAIMVAALLKLWWLTRPGDEGANDFGPPPTH